MAYGGKQQDRLDKLGRKISRDREVGIRQGSTKDAGKHTIWVRNDLWEFCRIEASKHKVPVRAIFEHALWMYMKDKLEKERGSPLQLASNPLDSLESESQGSQKEEESGKVVPLRDWDEFKT